MTYPAGSTVQWIHRTRTGGGSDYNGTEWTEAVPVSTTAVFAPGGSSETTESGDTVTTQPTLYGVDPALSVSAADVFVVDGKRFEVDGDPASGWQSPFTGWAPGQVVNLRRVTG